MFGFKKKATEYDKIIETTQRNIKNIEKLNRDFSYSAANFMANTDAMIAMARK